MDRSELGELLAQKRMERQADEEEKARKEIERDIEGVRKRAVIEHLLSVANDALTLCGLIGAASSYSRRHADAGIVVVETSWPIPLGQIDQAGAHANVDFVVTRRAAWQSVGRVFNRATKLVPLPGEDAVVIIDARVWVNQPTVDHEEAVTLAQSTVYGLGNLREKLTEPYGDIAGFSLDNESISTFTDIVRLAAESDAMALMLGLTPSN